MPLKRQFLMSGDRIPQPNRTVITRNCKCLTIRGERHGLDRTRMPLKGQLLLSGDRIPQPNRFVPTSTRQRDTIRGERH